MTVVSMNYLLEAGVHFGHQKRRWNPKMGEFIYTTREDVHIIDLQKSVRKIEESYKEINAMATNGAKFLFVGTKKQAQEASEESALRTNMYFINERWLGGTLTNFKTIKSRIRRMDDIDTMEKDGTFEALPKKEVLGIRKEYEKLNKNLRGIREMKKLPDALIIVDPRKEEIAIKEARILGIPIFGLVDTNCDPDMVDFVVPGNDDAVRSVKLIVGVLANAIAEANGNEMVDYITEDDKNNKRVDRTNDRDIKVMPIKAKIEEVKPAVEEVKTVVEEVKTVVEEVKPAVEEVKTVVEEVKPAVEEVKTIVEEVKKESADLSKLTVAELKAMAKEKNIEGYTSMKKMELVEALNK